MTSLFEFNTSAVAALSGENLVMRLTQLVDDIEHEVRDSLRKEAPGEDYDVYWEDGQIVIGLTEEQARQEFGEPGVPLQPKVRTALTGAAERLRTRLVIRD